MMSQQQLLAPISVGVMADYDFKYILFKLSIQISKKEKKEKRHRDIQLWSCHDQKGVEIRFMHMESENKIQLVTRRNFLTAIKNITNASLPSSAFVIRPLSIYVFSA